MQRFEEQVRGSRGRCAIARARIAPGTLVLPPTRAVAALSVTACSWCFRSPDDDVDDDGHGSHGNAGDRPAASNAKLRRCGGCKRLKYCSSTCQQLDWTRGHHARECSAYKCIPESVRNRALQTLLLVARLTAQLYIVAGDAGSEQEHLEVKQLRAHHEDHSAGKLQQYREMAQLVLVLLSRFKLSDTERARLDAQIADHTLLERVVALFCRVNCNAFTVSSAACAPRGLGVFPRGALFNHSCAPNCVVSFQAQHMVVRAVADIAAGEELTISYVELHESTDKRRRALADSYFFDCDCARCKTSERDDWYLDGHACAARSCASGVVVLADGAESGTCCVCATERRIERKRELEAECEAIERQLLKLALIDATATWRLYQRLHSLLVDALALHARNSRLATLWRELGTFVLHAPERTVLSLSDSGVETTALALFTRELSATEWVSATLQLPPRGLLHFQLGKLVYYGERGNSVATTSARPTAVVERARSHFQLALSILSRAYGAETALVRAVQAHLEELEWAHRQHQEP